MRLESLSTRCNALPRHLTFVEMHFNAIFVSPVALNRVTFNDHIQGFVENMSTRWQIWPGTCYGTRLHNSDGFSNVEVF